MRVSGMSGDTDDGKTFSEASLGGGRSPAVKTLGARRRGRATRPPTAVFLAAARLRERVWSVAEGELLGGESDLQVELGVTRSTLRQAARLLENEGLLMVRRGGSGGYFAARPNEAVILTAVAAYLQAHSVPLEDLTSVAAILWVQVMRLAACSKVPDLEQKIKALEDVVASANATTSYEQFIAAEMAFVDTVFDIAGSPYLALLIRINRAFGVATQSLHEDAKSPDWEAWKKLKRREIAAIRDRDEDLAVFAAQQTRKFLASWV
jgi:GntR family transcriptional regulator, transcriptional repressor for pyruvate dehydrogenase complex